MTKRTKMLGGTSIFLLIGFMAIVIIFGFTQGQVSSQNNDTCRHIPRNFIITNPGTYCLEKDLILENHSGIKILASDVVLDLGTYSLLGSFAKSKDAVTSAIRVDQNAHNITVKNGIIKEVRIGINLYQSEYIHIHNVKFSDIGAMAINSVASNSVFSNNVFENVGLRPLDPTNAYAIAINIGGENVEIEGNEILDINRQDLDTGIVGEAVAILVKSDCKNCIIKNNRMSKAIPDSNSYGIWNAGLGDVHIEGN